VIIGSQEPFTAYDYIANKLLKTARDLWVYCGGRLLVCVLADKGTGLHVFASEDFWGPLHDPGLLCDAFAKARGHLIDYCTPKLVLNLRFLPTAKDLEARDAIAAQPKYKTRPTEKWNKYTGTIRKIVADLEGLGLPFLLYQVNQDRNEKIEAWVGEPIKELLDTPWWKEEALKHYLLGQKRPLELALQAVNKLLAARAKLAVAVVNAPAPRRVSCCLEVDQGCRPGLQGSIEDPSISLAQTASHFSSYLIWSATL
jgi:hypothetical protein